MSSTLATVIFGLAASLVGGIGDFSGGIVSRRANASIITQFTYGGGLVFMIALALLWREPFPTPSDLLWAGLAGLAGTEGLMALYSAVSIGQMGVVAAISGILAVAIPVLFNAFFEGLPSLPRSCSIVLAMLAVGLIARPERVKGRSKGIGLALLSGGCFGGDTIFLSRVSPNAIFWPLAAMRLVGVLLLLVQVGYLRKKQGQGPLLLAGMKVVPLALLSSVLGTIGFIFFILALHAGRFDIAVVLSSFYPTVTVLLATLLLRERMTRIQAIGVLIALVAIPLISV